MAWGDAVNSMAENGRAPSFDSRGNVRGFRSRSGAPQADPTQNRGAINSTSPTLAGTATGNWNEMFRNKLTGNNPLSQEARTPPPTSGMPHVDTALSQITGTQWGTNNDFSPGGIQPDGSPAPPVASSKPTAPLDLTTMLSPTHAQSWGSAALTGTPNIAAGGGYQTGDPSAILKKYQTPNTTASYTQRGAGWPSNT